MRNFLFLWESKYFLFHFIFRNWNLWFLSNFRYFWFTYLTLAHFFPRNILKCERNHCICLTFICILCKVLFLLSDFLFRGRNWFELIYLLGIFLFTSWSISIRLWTWYLNQLFLNFLFLLFIKRDRWDRFLRVNQISLIYFFSLFRGWNRNRFDNSIFIDILQFLKFRYDLFEFLSSNLKFIIILQFWK